MDAEEAALAVNVERFVSDGLLDVFQGVGDGHVHMLRGHAKG